MLIIKLYKIYRKVFGAQLPRQLLIAINRKSSKQPLFRLLISLFIFSKVSERQSKLTIITY